MNATKPTDPWTCRACVAAGRDSPRDERDWHVGKCDLCRVITRLYPPREFYPAKEDRP